jgi:S-formylglutathione hydrolase FrmB
MLGWSMGGYGALLAAQAAPERFRAVVATSPALWTSPGATAPGAFDNAEDFRDHDVFAGLAHLSGVKVRLDCGTGDPFYVSTRQLAARLPDATASFRPGFHDPAYWRSVALDQMRWLGTAFASA